MDARVDIPQFDPPPRRDNANGETRRVGLELEMAGIRPEHIAKAVIAEIGGRAQAESAFLTRVHDTALGEFRIELDADVLKNRGYQKQLAELGIDIGEGKEREQIEHLLSRLAGLVVPMELVAPPVPWTQLDALDRIRQRLHQAGARGTHSSPLYAFGMQINIEAASLEVSYLLAVLRAFLLRYETLVEHEQVDLARRISPYIQPFPEEFIAHVLEPDYRPELTALIDDYLRLTPTRNRPLDLLPLFAHVDASRVMNAPVETALIKPRPAFHYRLPNCRIDEPGWSLAAGWNAWVRVEELAEDDRLRERRQRKRLSQSSRWRQGLSRLWRRLRR